MWLGDVMRNGKCMGRLMVSRPVQDFNQQEKIGRARVIDQNIYRCRQSSQFRKFARSYRHPKCRYISFKKIKKTETTHSESPLLKILL